MKEHEEYIDLKRIFAALWRRVWAIILVAAIFAGAAFGYTKFMVTPMYKARTLMYVNNSDISVGGANFSISASDLAAAQSLVGTYIVILNTRMTLNEVIDTANLNYSYEKLASMVSAEPYENTEIFAIQVTSPDPKEAELIANTIGMVLPDKISAVVEGSSVRIVDYAVEPAAPSSPSMTKNVALGALIGIFLTCAVLIILEMRDELIHDSDFLMQNFDIPVLAVIPDLQSSSNIPADYYYQSSTPKKVNGGDKNA